MDPICEYEMPAAERDLITNLRLADEETNGRPILALGQVPPARAWLCRILVDTDALLAHTDLLQKLYRVAYLPPLPRVLREWEPLPPQGEGFRHNHLLPEERGRAVAEQGPDILTAQELATLLLNPPALWDLADLIGVLLPAYWLPRLDEVGRRIMDEYDLDFPIPGEDEAVRTAEPVRARGAALAGALRGRGGVEAQGGGGWRLLFGDDAARALARRIAAHAWGDPETAFTLTLYRVPVAGRADVVQAEVEVSPAPTRNDLVLTVTFPAGGERSFTLEVPPEVRADPEAEPRAKTRSEPCEPLPAAAFDFDGGEWRDDAWPPHLMLQLFSEGRHRTEL